VLLFINGGHDPIQFRFPQPDLHWTLLIDSAAPDAPGGPFGQTTIDVQGHSVMLFGTRAAGERG
jgi:hypothetical protein